jgi:hypothetical protein
MRKIKADTSVARSPIWNSTVALAINEYSHRLTELTTILKCPRITEMFLCTFPLNRQRPGIAPPTAVPHPLDDVELCGGDGPLHVVHVQHRVHLLHLLLTLRLLNPARVRVDEVQVPLSTHLVVVQLDLRGTVAGGQTQGRVAQQHRRTKQRKVQDLQWFRQAS